MNTTTISSLHTSGGRAPCGRCNGCTQFAPSDPFPFSGNVTQSQALAFLNLADSTAYAYGVIPKYNDDGSRINTDKVPPFPWLPLPDVTTLKPVKMWDAADIRELHASITKRTRSRIAGTDFDKDHSADEVIR